MKNRRPPRPAWRGRILSGNSPSGDHPADPTASARQQGSALTTSPLTGDFGRLACSAMCGLATWSSSVCLCIQPFLLVHSASLLFVLEELHLLSLQSSLHCSVYPLLTTTSPSILVRTAELSGALLQGNCYHHGSQALPSYRHHRRWYACSIAASLAGQQSLYARFARSTGLSGITLAINIKQRLGLESFTIYERDMGPGGTWRQNTYPGCACDVPSHCESKRPPSPRSSDPDDADRATSTGYSLSTELNPDWTETYSSQPEIHRCEQL